MYASVVVYRGTVWEGGVGSGGVGVGVGVAGGARARGAGGCCARRGSVRIISEGVSTRMCASASRSPPAVTVTLGARTAPGAPTIAGTAAPAATDVTAPGGTSGPTGGAGAGAGVGVVGVVVPLPVSLSPPVLCRASILSTLSIY